MTGTVIFRAIVELHGRTATGIQVPDEIMPALGPGKRPAVRVTIGRHTYDTTIGSMGGRFLIPLSAENRAAAGVVAGDEVEVTVAANAVPREVTVPEDLKAALDQDDPARAFFETLAYSHRKEWVRWIEEAKQPATRAKRLQATLEALRAGRRGR